MPREVKYRGKKIQVALETSLAADGQPVTRDVVIHPGAVAILPLVDAERVCLLRNRRPNVGETLIEIPAGTLEPGEAPDVAGPRAGRGDRLPGQIVAQAGRAVSFARHS